MLAPGAPQNASIKEALTKTFDWRLSQKCPACKCVGRVHGGDDQELHRAISSSLGAESFLDYLIGHLAFGEVERLSSKSFFLEKYRLLAYKLGTWYPGPNR